MKKPINSKTKALRRCSLLVLSLVATRLPASIAHAEIPAAAPNTHAQAPSTIDENGVDMASGEFVPPLPGASIGNAESGFTDSFGGYGFPKSSSFLGGVTVDGYTSCENGYCDEYAADANKNDQSLVVHFGNYTKEFSISGQDHYVATDGSSDTLDGYLTSNDPYGLGNVEGGYTLTTSDGTVVEFGADSSADFGTDAKYAGISSITKPDGEVITFGYNVEHTATPNDTDLYPGGPPPYFVQVNQVSVHSSLGWTANGMFDAYGSSFSMGNAAYTGSIYYGYGAVASAGTDYTNQTQTSNGQEVVKEQMTRILTQSTNAGTIKIWSTYQLRTKFQCDYPNTPSTYPWVDPAEVPNYPQNVGYCATAWQESFNKSVSAVYPSGRMITATYYTPPDDFEEHSDSFGGCMRKNVYMRGSTCVHYVDRGGSRWTYSYNTAYNSSTQRTETTVTRVDPQGHTRTVLAFDGGPGYGTLITSVTNELNQTTSYDYNTYNQLTKITYPEGNHTDFHYNDRGDVTETDTYPKSGSAPNVTTAGYDVTCSNPKTCNKPNWTKDADGHETDYTYDSTHGGVLTVTGPADASGVRPQTRYHYSQVVPHGRDSNGSVTNSTPVWRVDRKSSCLKAVAGDPAWCVTNDPADEQVTSYTYNDNVLLASETVANGSGAVSLTTSFTYDRFGNRVVVDGPRTDVDDRSYTSYDALRRPVYEIGVDPDGSGPLQRVVIHHVYDVDGNEIRTETGTGSAITFDGDGAPTGVSDFAVTSFKRMTFDPSTGLLVKTEVVQP